LTNSLSQEAQKDGPKGFLDNMASSESSLLGELLLNALSTYYFIYIKDKSVVNIYIAFNHMNISLKVISGNEILTKLVKCLINSFNDWS